MNLYYKLTDDNEIVPDTLDGWCESMKTHWALQSRVNGVLVSTVFLGLVHGHRGRLPILFETMAFLPDGHSHEQYRCCTYEEALAQHETMKADLLAALN